MVSSPVGPKTCASVLGGKASHGRRDGLNVVCGHSPPATTAGVSWLSPPSCHKSRCPSITTLPSPRLASSILCLNWHPFANAGLNCFCRVLNPDPQRTRLLGWGVPGSKKGPWFLILLLSHLPKCHLVGLVVPLCRAESQEPAHTGCLPSQGCSVLPPPPNPRL